MFRTCGGEAVLVRLRNGTAADAAGAGGEAHSGGGAGVSGGGFGDLQFVARGGGGGGVLRRFNRRRRKDPAFARELRLALQQGYEALEMALLESGLAGSHEHDDWRENDRPAIPPMTANQALQLMYLHQKEALMLAEPLIVKRRRGESERGA